MTEKTAARGGLAPFIVVDIVFVGLAAALFTFAHRPLLWWEASLLVVCAALGAACLLAPLLRDASQQAALAQTNRLADLTAELQKLQQIADQVNASTEQWKSLGQHTTESLNAASQLSQTVAAETKNFSAALQKANDQEKTHLRVQIDNLRRAETEWVQTTLRILDHIFALHRAAEQTGQANLVEQISLFQNACLDAARRVGLAQAPGRPGDPVDARLHQLPDNAEPPADARIAQILAPGYTYQGSLARRALVLLDSPVAAPSE